MIGWRGGYGAPKAPGRAPDVVVIVSGGLVQDVLRDPDLTVEVRDYDVSEYGTGHEFNNFGVCAACHRTRAEAQAVAPLRCPVAMEADGFEQDDAGDWFSRSTYEADAGRARKRRHA